MIPSSAAVVSRLHPSAQIFPLLPFVEVAEEVVVDTEADTHLMAVEEAAATVLLVVAEARVVGDLLAAVILPLPIELYQKK
jgi:hypothetical protein